MKTPKRTLGPGDFSPGPNALPARFSAGIRQIQRCYISLLDVEVDVISHVEIVDHCVDVGVDAVGVDVR